MSSEHRARMSNVDNVRLWILALESGEFQQTTGVLRRTEEKAAVTGKSAGHCCLGVAVEVALRAGVDVRVTAKLAESGDWGDQGLWSALPAVREFYGTTKAQPSLSIGSRPDPVGYGATAKVLAYVANDSLRWTFAQIAEALREDYGIPKDNA